MRTRTRSETNNFIKQVEAENEGPMKEITDERLSELRASLSVCNPLVQSLVARLDRVEWEKAQLQERLTFQDRWLSGGIYYTNEEATQLFEKHNAQLTALRERVKELKTALDEIADTAAPYAGNGMETIHRIAQAALKEGA